jgi:putative sterol carrier protein
VTVTVDTPTLSDVLADLPRRALPDRLAALSGTVRYETPHDAQALRFDGGRVSEPPAGAGADVVVRARADVLAGVVAGELNAGVELLRGSVEIEGDTELALAMGGMFEVAGCPGVAVDPRALDPVEVATVLGEVSGRHLETVMRSGFRPVVLGEIFRRLPDFVNPTRAARVDLAVGFRLTGHPSGELERYVVSVRHGAATVSEGDDGAPRDATVTCEGHDFLRLATGHLSPVFGVLRGRLKVRGEQAKALQLTSVLDIPRAG